MYWWFLIAAEMSHLKSVISTCIRIHQTPLYSCFCLSICLSLCLSVCLSVCPSVCLSIVSIYYSAIWITLCIQILTLPYLQLVTDSPNRDLTFHPNPTAGGTFGAAASTALSISKLQCGYDTATFNPSFGTLSPAFERTYDDKCSTRFSVPEQSIGDSLLFSRSKRMNLLTCVNFCL
jgi:hypothetical protein